MIVLDICRTNLLPENDVYYNDSRGSIKKRNFLPRNIRGLSLIEPDSLKPSNTMIFYSTDANSIAWDGDGKNSPFAESFVKWISKPIEILDVIRNITHEVKTKTKGKQKPCVYTSLDEKYILNRQKDSLVISEENKLKDMINKIDNELSRFYNAENTSVKKTAPKYVRD